VRTPEQYLPKRVREDLYPELPASCSLFFGGSSVAAFRRPVRGTGRNQKLHA
jgi:hypothetical protein